MAIGAAKKVVILGGGVAGMSAAHELTERGFQVEVFERKGVPGGKARSIAASAAGGLVTISRGTRQASGHFGRPPLPGEHGFRFFPGFYKHIVDTMQRIPYGAGTVAQNLVDTSELEMACFDRPSYKLPAEFPRTPGDLKVALFAGIAVLSGHAGIPLEDGAFFATKLWEFATSCEERRLVEYERINWWDFIEAGSRSAQYQKYFGSGITRSLVAAKARRASAKTIGDIFLQIVFDVLSPGVAADRLLNGPTNDVWIDPWLKHLRERGVRYHFDAEVCSIRCHNAVVQSVSVVVAGSPREVRADYFIGALPVERMAELVNQELLKGDASLANLHELTEYVEWMNGIQFYLTEDVPIAKGHAIFIDSPWALTAVSQAQFWKNFDLTQYGDGTVKGLLSVDISDWDVKGLNGKKAENCSREEIALETWAQLKKSLNSGAEVLRDEQLHSWFLDPSISTQDADSDPLTPQINTNLEPLLVNYVDTWRLRPEAVTRIVNFFLASDYVRTFTDLATMEAANEAARRAVNGILRASRSAAEPCRLWNLHEPELFLPLRAYDRMRYRRGLPWDAGAMDLARSLLGLAHQAAVLGEGSPYAGPLRIFQEGVQRVLGVAPTLVAAEGAGKSAENDAGEQRSNEQQVAAEARESSDHGLRRLRIIRTEP